MNFIRGYFRSIGRFTALHCDGCAEIEGIPYTLCDCAACMACKLIEKPLIAGVSVILKCQMPVPITRASCREGEGSVRNREKG